MSDNSSINQLLDLLIDALEERKAERALNGSAPPVASIEPAAWQSENDPEPTVELVEPEPVEPSEPETPMAVRLPMKWKPFRQVGVQLADQLEPKHIQRLSNSKPAMRQLTPLMLSVMPADTLAALPDWYLRGLDEETFALVEERMLEVPQLVEMQETVPDTELATTSPHAGQIELPSAQPQESAESTPRQPAKSDTVQFTEPLPDETADAQPVPEAAPIIEPIRVAIPDNMPRTIVRMFASLILFIIIANLNIGMPGLERFVGNNDGVERIRIARDGTLLQGFGNAVYVIEDNKRRWITTSEAFEFYDYRWGNVRRVQESFLQQFEEGEPIYLLMKCPGAPHIYALGYENNRRVRKWIRDIETFTAEGFTWNMVSEDHCAQLIRTVDGTTIPPGETDIPRP